MIKTSNKFFNFCRLTLVCVFFVIIAGGVVRMTQSGMGCPDWPKCFGRWIPPTDESQLPANYKEIYSFKYVDTSFNVYHTWTEYVNRLIGALLGVFLIIQLVWSFKFIKSHRNIFWLAFIELLLTGFQGWLGAKVVDSNLAPLKITIHMLVAILILMLSILIVNSMVRKYHIITRIENYGKLKGLIIVGLILLAIQIVLGTNVRQQIDDISLTLNFTQREKWIDRLDFYFLIHRTFSLVIAGLAIYVARFCYRTKIFRSLNNLILFLIFCEVLLGITLTYFKMPAIAQPLHLLFSTGIFAAQYYLFARVK